MNKITKRFIVVGTLSIPAVTTLGLVYGVHKEDWKLKDNPPVTQAEKYFDQAISSSSSNFVSNMLISPVNGNSLSELVRLDEELSYENLMPLLKKENGLPKPFYTRVVKFNDEKSGIDFSKEFLKINQEIYEKTINSANNNEPNRTTLSKGIKDANDKVKISKGSSRVGLDVRKDIVKREIVVSLYDLVDEDKGTSKIADDFMKNVGTMDLSKIKFDPQNPTSFYEIFSADQRLSFSYFHNKFSSPNVDKGWNFDKETKMKDGWINQFEKDTGIEWNRDYIKQFLQSGPKDYHSLKAMEMKLSSDKDVDKSIKKLMKMFPKIIKQKALDEKKSPEQFLKESLDYFSNFTRDNPRYSKGVEEMPFYNKKNKAPVTWNVNPTYDFKSGKVKIIFSFMEVNKKYNSDGEIISSSSISDPERWRISDYSNISRRVVSFDVKEIIPHKNGAASVANKEDAIKTLKNMLGVKLKDFIYKGFVPAGIKLLQGIVPGLGSMLGDLGRVIKLLNNPNIKSEVLTNEFVGRLVDIITKDERVDINGFVKMMKKFDANEWGSLDRLTHIDSKNGGEFDLFLLISSWSDMSKPILEEIEKKVPGAEVTFTGPIIKEMLDELKSLDLINPTTGVDDIMKDYLKYGKQMVLRMVTKNIKLSESFYTKILPKIPVAFIEKNIGKLTKALKELNGNGLNLREIFNEIIIGNPVLMDKLVKEWAAEPNSFNDVSYITWDIKVELLINWFTTPEALKISLTSEKENILSVLMKSKFSPKTMLVISRTAIATGLLPEFVGLILPKTLDEAKGFSRIFVSGEAEETLKQLHKVYKEGLERLTKHKANGVDSDFVVKMKDLFKHIFENINIEKMLPDSSSEIASKLRVSVSEKLVKLISDILNTPVLEWGKFLTPNSDLMKFIDIAKHFMSPKITAKIDNIVKLIPTISKLLDRGLKEVISPKNGGLSGFISEVKPLVDVSKYEQLIEGVMHGFHGNWENAKKIISSLFPGLLEKQFLIKGKVFKISYLIEGIITGNKQLGPSLYFMNIMSLAIDRLFGDESWNVLVHLFKDGFLSLAPNEISIFIHKVSEIMTINIFKLDLLFIHVNIGSLAKLIPNIATKELIDKLSTLGPKTSHMIDELINKPLKEISSDSIRELCGILRVFLHINIPSEIEEGIIDLLKNPIDSLGEKGVSDLSHIISRFVGTQEGIKKLLMKILIGSSPAISH